MTSIKQTLVLFILSISYQTFNNINAQTNAIVLDGAYIVLDGGTATNNIYIVIDQPSTDGITRLASGGHIHSESQYNFIKWMSGSATGNYVFPFGVAGNMSDYIPFSFNKTAGNSSISVSTWGTDVQNMPHPLATNVGPVTTMNNGITDSVEYAIDRFWDIRADATTADLTFSYRGIENTTLAPTELIQAQHWNGSSWDSPVGPGTTGVTTGVGSAGPFVDQSTFSPWVLVAPCSEATGTDTQIVCGSFTWIDGNTYTTDNNTATHTIVGGAANGCDSIVTLDLTINTFVTGTDVQEACGSFTWIDGNTYTTDNNTATHTIVGGAANGCDSIVTLDLTINTFVTGTDVQEACGSFTWIDGNTYTTDNNTATHTIVGGAASGCDSIITLDLTITSSPEITASSNGELCDGETLNLAVTTVSGASYQWTGPNGFVSSNQNPIVSSPSAGIYEVIASSGVDCEATAQVDVIIHPLPILNSTISDDNCGAGIGSIIVDVISPNPPFTYVWNNGETSSALMDLSAGVYQVTVSDDKCSIQNAFSIFNKMNECNCLVYVSNAFSPNGDGNNDFIPVRGKCVSSLSFKIFNRWGNLVFETDKLNDGWDGYYKGELQNTGIYVYVLEATLENGETVSESGDITLLR